MTDRLAGPGLSWWQRGIVYQIYPRSFQDSNGDGIGDLEGIRQRLSHVKWLGVDAIWLTPIFVATSYHGYNVTDYFHVDPRLAPDGPAGTAGWGRAARSPLRRSPRVSPASAPRDRARAR